MTQSNISSAQAEANLDQAGLDQNDLTKAFACLKDEDEVMRFIKDLMTPGELQALAERWRVARLLNEGDKSYREISQETGVSTTTVTRVARFLTQENFQGYRLVLDRWNQKD